MKRERKNVEIIGRFYVDVCEELTIIIIFASRKSKTVPKI